MEIERFIRSVRDEESDLDPRPRDRVVHRYRRLDPEGSRTGRRGWRDLLERHHATVRGSIARHRGQEVDTAGDGFFATFDGPARGVRCAQQIVKAVRPLGIEIRAGVHTGECAKIDDKVGGLGVVIGARVGALAGPSEVLVSQTVNDLVAGSGLDVRGRRRARAEGCP